MHANNSLRKQQAMRALDALLSSSTSRPPAGPSYDEQPSPPTRHDTQADPPGPDPHGSDTDPNLDSHDEEEGLASNAAPSHKDSQRQWLLQRQEMERQLQRQQQKQQQQLLQQHEQLRTEHQERLALNYQSHHQDPRHQRQHAGRTTDEAEDADEEDEDEEDDEDGQEGRSKQNDTQEISPRKHHGHIAQSTPQQGTEKTSAATTSNSNRPRKYNKSKANDRGATSSTPTTPSNAPKRQYKKTILRQQAALLAAQLKEENKARDSEATRRVLARTGVIKHLRSLKSRLSFAQYKVDKGWEDQPLPLVTELFEESLEDSGDSNDELAPFMPFRRAPSATTSTTERIAPSQYARAISTAAPVHLSEQKPSRHQVAVKSAQRKGRGSEQAQGLLSHRRSVDQDGILGLMDSEISEADENVWDTPCSYEGAPAAMSRQQRNSESSRSLSPSGTPLNRRQHPPKRVDASAALRSSPSTRTFIKHQQKPGYQRPLSSNCSEAGSEDDSVSESGQHTSSKTINLSRVQPEMAETVASSQTVPSTQEELQRQQRRQLEELQRRQLEQLQELQQLQQKQQMELQKAHAQMAHREPAPSKSDDLRLKTRNVSRPKDTRPGNDKENSSRQSGSASGVGRRHELLQAQKQTRMDGRYDRSLPTAMTQERHSSGGSVAKPTCANPLPSRSDQTSAPIVRKQQQSRPSTPLTVRQQQQQQQGQNDRGPREQSHNDQRERPTNMRQEEYRQHQRKKLQQNEEKEQELFRLQRRLEQQHLEQQRRKTLLLQLQKPTQPLQEQTQGRREVLRPELQAQLVTPKKKKPLNPVQKAPSTENILASVRYTHSNVRSTLVSASPSMATAKNILLGSKRMLQSVEDKENFASPTSSPIRRTQYNALDSSEWAARQPTSSKGVKRQKPAISPTTSAVSRSGAIRATNSTASIASMGLNADPSPFMVSPGMAHASSSQFTAALLNTSPEVQSAVATVPDGVQSNKEFLNCFDQWMSDLGTDDIAGLSSVPSSNTEIAEVHLADSNAQEPKAGAISGSRNESAAEKSEKEEAEEEEEEFEEDDDEDDANQTGQSGLDDETELDDTELDRLLYSEVGDDYFYTGQGAVSTPGSDFGSTQDLNSDGATPDLYDWFPDAIHDDGTPSLLTAEQHLSLLSTDPILSSSPGELSQGLELGLEFDTAGDPLWLQQELQLQRQQLEHHHHQQQQLESQEQNPEQQHDHQVQPLLCSSRDGTPQLDSTTSTLLSSSSLADMLPGSTLLGGSHHYVPLGLGGEPMSDHSVVHVDDHLGKTELLMSGHPSSVDYYFST
ncbi:hypothetical protein BGZ67_009392 [Mortierella alpina]|nr:hypothetical protein BGZ67_009392 [Mortierella alpina]